MSYQASAIGTPLNGTVSTCATGLSVDSEIHGSDENAQGRLEGTHGDGTPALESCELAHAN